MSSSGDGVVVQSQSQTQDGRGPVGAGPAPAAGPGHKAGAGRPQSPGRPGVGGRDRSGRKARGPLTPRKARANRANARHSTGPRTAEGKALVARNATKHGLFSAGLLPQGQDAAALEEFRGAMLAEYGAEGPVVRLLAERVVEAVWRLRRAAAYGDLVARARAADCRDSYRSGRQGRRPRRDRMLGRAALDLLNDGTLDQLLEYEHRLEGAMLKSLAQLEEARPGRARRPAEADDAADPSDDDPGEPQ